MVDIGASAASLRRITHQQSSWAREMGLDVDQRLRTSTVDLNLFAPLHPDTKRDFTLGQGDEYGTPEQPGKLASLVSSAALVVNVFDIWRGAPAEPVCHALELDPRYRVSRFEAIHPTGLRGTPPHLDLQLEAPDLPVVAIESKFTEPYRAVTNSFRPSYFSSSTLWSSFPNTHRLAMNIVNGEPRFYSLHVTQLIKHALGLSRSYGRNGFVLVYLWYRAQGPHGDLHQREVEQFSAQVEDDFVFRATTYQELLTSIPNGPDGWLEYLSARYMRED